MAEPITVHLDEIKVLCDQLAANPPDGDIQLEAAENGSLIASWESHGNPTKVGPTETRQLPP